MRWIINGFTLCYLGFFCTSVIASAGCESLAGAWAGSWKFIPSKGNPVTFTANSSNLYDSKNSNVIFNFVVNKKHINLMGKCYNGQIKASGMIGRHVALSNLQDDISLSGSIVGNQISLTGSINYFDQGNPKQGSLDINITKN